MTKDYLTDDVLSDILEQFDVEHAFPATFVKEEVKDDFDAKPSLFGRARRWIAALFGYGSRDVAAADHQPGIPVEGGEVEGP
jgi:hypothetical protein